MDRHCRAVVPNRDSLYRPAFYLMFLAWGLGGCDAPSIAPPPSPELGSLAERDRAAQRPAELILAGDTVDRVFWAAKASPAADRRRMILHETHLSADDPPAKQAELILAKLESKPSVLIVEPADAPEVVDALRAAQAKSVPIVLLDRAVPGLSGSGPVTLVTLPDFGPSAKSIVTAARESAKASNSPADGHAILLANARTDRHSADRVAALRSAIEAAGLTLNETYTFKGQGEEIEIALQEKLKADPKLTFIFAEEDQGLAAANYVRFKLPEKRPIAVAGYFHFDSRDEPVPVNGCVMAVDGNQRGLIAKAVDAAFQLSKGEKIPERIEVPLILCPGGRRPAAPQEGPPPATHP